MWTVVFVSRIKHPKVVGMMLKILLRPKILWIIAHKIWFSGNLWGQGTWTAQVTALLLSCPHLQWWWTSPNPLAVLPWKSLPAGISEVERVASWDLAGDDQTKWQMLLGGVDAEGGCFLCAETSTHYYPSCLHLWSCFSHLWLVWTSERHRTANSTPQNWGNFFPCGS